MKKNKTTEHLAFLEELKRSWVATVDAIQDPLFEVDENLKVIRTNEAMATWAQKPIKEIIGSSCYKIFADRKSPCTHCPIKQKNKTSSNSIVKLEPVLENQYFEVSSRAIKNIENKSKTFVHIYRNRTDFIQKERKLIQSEKLASIGLLAGGVAHEINNPLGAILIFAQMIQKTNPNNPQIQTDVEEIIAAAKRCKDIVESMLDFSRTSPEGSNEISHANIDEAVTSAWRFAKMQDGARKINFIYKKRPKSIMVAMDHNKLIQLLLNLFQNAVHAMPRGGDLSLHIETDSTAKNSIKMHIKDQGHGIKKSDLKHIFDPFFTTKQPGQGTGLGLSVCFALVKEVNGEIRVNSEENKGTCFTIELPLYHEMKKNIKAAS